MYWLALYLTRLTCHVFDTAQVSMSEALRDSTELTQSALSDTGSTSRRNKQWRTRSDLTTYRPWGHVSPVSMVVREWTSGFGVPQNRVKMGPIASSPMIAVRSWHQTKNTLFVKRFDASNVNDVIYNAFLEADRTVIVHMCDWIGPFIFHSMLEFLSCFD